MTRRDGCTALLGGDQLLDEAFSRFGIDVQDKSRINPESLKICEALARLCLPVIGESCRGVIELFESMTDVQQMQRHTQSSEEVDEEYDQLVSEMKRLTALRSADRSISAACQATAELLNKGANILQKTAPLIASTNIADARSDAFKLIKTPELSTSHGEVHSLSQIMSRMPVFDEVGRFSLNELVQHRVYDSKSTENFLDFLRSGLSELVSQSGATNNLVEHRKCSRSPLRILAAVRFYRNLHGQLRDAVGTNNNQIVTDKYFVKLRETIRLKCSAVSGLDLLSGGDASNPMMVNQVEVIDTRERLCQNIQAYCAHLNENESIEDQIRTMTEEIYSSHKLFKSLDSFVNMIRFQKNGVRSCDLTPLLSPSKSSNSIATILQRALPVGLSELSSERSTLDADNNRDAIEYLASLENSVDTKRLHTIKYSLCGPLIDELAEELRTFKTLKVLQDFSEFTCP